MSKEIKFGTDGWRAIMGEDFNIENLKRVASATAEYLIQHNLPKKVIVGYDTRLSGELFSKVAARVFAHKGIKVLLSDSFVSTPMVSFATYELDCGLGIIITASHNPSTYNGYKIKAAFGGPALQQAIKEVESFIPSEYKEKLPDFDELMETGSIQFHDLESLYCNHVARNFDLEAIKKSGIKIAFDAMYGAGQNVMKQLLPSAVCFRCEPDPSFKGITPEPTMRNLGDFVEFIKKEGDIDLAIATDGDADRIGILDKNGNFIDAHHIILILIDYLYKYKNLTGMVAVSSAVTHYIDKMCKTYGLEHKITPIGFKHICEIMQDNDVLVGGEEAGGMAVKGHIPDRDGIWIGLLLAEHMAKEGKTLDELIENVYKITGRFKYERKDLHIDEGLKHHILETCINNGYDSFGDYRVQKVETIDGFKYFFDDERWLMLRASGTEPVLRVYAQAPEQNEALKLISQAEQVILAAENKT